MPIEPEASNVSEGVRLLRQRLSRIETEEGRLKGLSYIPRANDIAITTTPKAGTTWMQQICHQLRAAGQGGDMNFEEISEVVPWIELAADQGQDLNEKQYGEAEGKPRFFKTHAWEVHCPKFPKTIVVLRSPYDVVQSFYNFFEGWFFEPGSITLDEFAQEFWLARDAPTNRMQNASYFVHLTSWYKRRDDPSVLFVFFEDLKDDLRTQVKRIADFVSNDSCCLSSDEFIDVAVAKSSYDFMRDNAYHFDEKLSKRSRNEACGLPKDAGMNESKIKGGKKQPLSDELRSKIDRKWMEVVYPVTSCESYEKLRKRMKR